MRQVRGECTHKSIFWIAAPMAIRSLSLLYEIVVSRQTTIDIGAPLTILLYEVNCARPSLVFVSWITINFQG